MGRQLVGRLINLLSRTRTKIHFGGVGRMGRVRTSSGKHWDGCENIYATNKGREILEFFVRRFRWDFMTL